MGMSTFVLGFKPPDNKWKEMKAVWDSCEKADIEIPDEVEEFFDGEKPDAAGVEIDLENDDCCKEYNEDMRDGFEIEIRS